MTSNTPYSLYLSRLSPSGRRAVRSQLESIAKLLGWAAVEREHKFNQIDYPQALHLIALMQQRGWSARYINRGMTAIKCIVKTAVLSGEASEKQSLQLQAIPRLRHGEHPGKPLDTKQVERLFTSLASDTSLIGYRDHLIFALFLGLGLRLSEVLAVRVEDIDFKASSVTVLQGKGNKSRTCYLPKWVKQVMRNWLKRSGETPQVLACKILKSGAINSCKSLTSTGLYKIVKTRLSDVGIDAAPHDLRRTYITRLLEQGVDINTVRQMAGHADISTTTIYDKRDHKTMKRAANALSYGGGNG